MRHFRHYYYPRRRTAYGPRQGRPHAYIAEAASLSARDLAGLPHAETLGLRFSALTMPCGGVRLVVICPDCQRPRARLYTTVGAPANRWPTFWPWVCRVCAGLVYWRQYEGRRLEAADNLGMPERALWAMRQGYRGWHDALDTWRERDASHDARAWVALTINRMRLDQMIAYHQRLDELNAAAHESVAAYRQARRQSEHTATIKRLDAEIRKLRAKQARQRVK